MGGENLEFWDGLPLAKGGSQIADHNSGNKGPIWKTNCNLFSGGVTMENGKYSGFCCGQIACLRNGCPGGP